MAALSAWSIAIWALLPPFAAVVLMALRGTVAHRLVAAQFAAGLTSLLLVLMSFAFDQPSYIDLALTLAVLNVAGALMLAVAVERWL